MAILTDKQTIDRFLTRAVENVYPTREKLGQLLASGERIKVYTGIDPTGPTLHIGHAIWLKKLAELQKMGHHIIMLIGDFTAMIGDPTDKLATRKQLTREEVLANCQEYKKQASKIIAFDGPNPAELLFNNDWLGKMSFADVVELASHFTVQQMMERDMFQARYRGQLICPSCKTIYSPSSQIKFTGPTIKDEAEGTGMGEFSSFILDEICPTNHSFGANYEKRGILSESEKIEIKKFIIWPKPIFLHEFLYPLMQGYDSVAMEVDLEIGGNDQTFNMLAGRTLLREMKQKEKMVLTCKLLVDQTGKKMGKSEGNMIMLSDSPEDMYGKVMSWTDGMIWSGFELCTDVSDEEIEAMKAQMDAGENPMTFKRRLAKEVVATFLSPAAAEEAEAHFTTVHQKHETPEEVSEYVLSAPAKLVDVLVTFGLVSSKTDARRQIEQGGIKVDGEVVTDVLRMVSAPALLQKGKRHFIRLIP